MADKKELPFAILEILETFSDENHILSISDIMSHLEKCYHLKAERRTIYANIDLLRSFGYDISTWGEQHKGYYLRSRIFSRSEILMLCNAVHASHFINQDESEALINKLLSFLNRYQQDLYRSSVYMPNPQKTENEELMTTIDLIARAVRDGHPVSFTYLKYSMDKKLVPRREEDYCIEPRGIVYEESRPYVVATTEDHADFSHYRLDRMRSVRIDKDTVVPPLNEKQSRQFKDIYNYARYKLFMYSDETVSARLVCQNSCLNQIIDFFGPEELTLHKYDDDHFEISVKGSRTGLLIFAQQYIDKVVITYPESLKEEMRQRIENAQKAYQQAD